MSHSNIVKFTEPGAFEEPLTEVLRGARKLQTVEAKVSEVIIDNALKAVPANWEPSGIMSDNILALHNIEGMWSHISASLARTQSGRDAYS